MKKINLKGITPEAITGILILIVALVNAVLQMADINPLPIADEEISAIVSGVFLVGAALYNTYKNRNVTTGAQEAQKILDALKDGTLVAKDVQELISKIKNNKG